MSATARKRPRSGAEGALGRGQRSSGGAGESRRSLT
jgi:hypothetical protein